MTSKRRMEGDKMLNFFCCLLRSLFFVDCIMSQRQCMRANAED